MVLLNIYFFFYDLQNYLFNFYNKYILFNIFSKKYIKKNDSDNSDNSDSDNSDSDNSQDFYYYLKEKYDNKNYNYMICKKCNKKIINEIYLFNDYYFCSKFCRKHYSYKI